MSTLKSIRHPPASSTVVTTQATATVQVSSDASSAERVWVSTNPLVCIFPWYGTPVAPGASATIFAAPGQTVYTHAPLGPASITATIT